MQIDSIYRPINSGYKALKIVSTGDKSSPVEKRLSILRFAKERDDGFHLCPGEHLGILLVAYILHRLPHAARLVHLATKEAKS